MTNMSYCRFENTYHDLQDCADNINDIEDLSESEKRYRRWLIETCRDIIEMVGDELDEENEND